MRGKSTVAWKKLLTKEIIVHIRIWVYYTVLYTHARASTHRQTESNYEILKWLSVKCHDSRFILSTYQTPRVFLHLILILYFASRNESKRKILNLSEVKNLLVYYNRYFSRFLSIQSITTQENTTSRYTLFSRKLTSAPKSCRTLQIYVVWMPIIIFFFGVKMLLLNTVCKI